MKLKQFYTGCMLSASLLTLFGCQANESDQNVEQTNEIVTTITNPVELEFWHSMNGDLEKALNDLVDTFNTSIGAEKGITIKPVYQGSYDDLKSKITAAIKSGSTPAITQGASNYIAEFMQAGVVQPLDDYIFNEEVGIKDFDDIYEAYRNENSQYTEDGKFYSLPFNKSTDVLYYNKTFFEENGLEVPTTWAEMEEVSKQITALTNKPAFGIDSSENYVITMIKQLGGEYTSSTGEI